MADGPVPDVRPVDELSAGLRRVFDAVDPVPEVVVEAGKAAFAMRTIDEELAGLSYDSLLEAGLAGVRSGATTLRTLSFEAGERSVEIEVEPGVLVGQLLPAEAAQVDVRTVDAVTRLATDELGRFELRPVPSGPLSLRIRRAGGATIVTEWTAI